MALVDGILATGIVGLSVGIGWIRYATLEARAAIESTPPGEDPIIKLREINDELLGLAKQSSKALADAESAVSQGVR